LFPSRFPDDPCSQLLSFSVSPLLVEIVAPRGGKWLLPPCPAFVTSESPFLQATTGSFVNPFFFFLCRRSSRPLVGLECGSTGTIFLFVPPLTIAFSSPYPLSSRWDPLTASSQTHQCNSWDSPYLHQERTFSLFRGFPLSFGPLLHSTELTVRCHFFLAPGTQLNPTSLSLITKDSVTGASLPLLNRTRIFLGNPSSPPLLGLAAITCRSLLSPPLFLTSEEIPHPLLGAVLSLFPSGSLPPMRDLSAA